MSEIDEVRRRSFDASAELYDDVRPGYPDALAEELLATAGRRVLEIGAGTGKATVVFARHGASIVHAAAERARDARRAGGCNAAPGWCICEAWRVSH